MIKARLMTVQFAKICINEPSFQVPRRVTLKNIHHIFLHINVLVVYEIAGFFLLLEPFIKSFLHLSTIIIDQLVQISFEFKETSNKLQSLPYSFFPPAFF